MTGASQGIGEQIAYQFAKHGARVLITSRSAENLKRVVATMTKLGAADAEFVVADLELPEDRRKLIQVVTEFYGGADFRDFKGNQQTLILGMLRAISRS